MNVSTTRVLVMVVEEFLDRLNKNFYMLGEMNMQNGWSMDFVVVVQEAFHCEQLQIKRRSWPAFFPG